jgi:Ca-activated chloride channel family protein
MVYRQRDDEGQPKGHVLGLDLGTDRARIPPGRSDASSTSGPMSGVTPRVHLVADVRATAEGVERQRPPLSLIFVLDVSGSMAGPPLEQVVLSVERMVGLLDPTDKVGVVAFSDNATEVVSLQPVTGEAKAKVRSRVHRLHADGHTNLESGLRRAAAMLPKRGQHERQVLIVLSDGIPNRGTAAPDELMALAKSYRPDVSISTLGYGAHHHEDALAAVSNGGGGRYHYIADPSVCEFEFAQAIGTQGDVVAEAVELLLTPAPGVEIARFLGKPETRFGAAGLVVSLPDMLDGSTHLTVAELTLKAPREPGRWEIATAVLTYRKAGERHESRIEQRLVMEVGSGDAAIVPAVYAQVLRMRCEEVRSEARALADRGQFEGAAALLRRWIGAIEAAPGFSAGDGSALADAHDVMLDEAMAMERKPNMEDYQRFRRTSLTSSLATEAPPSMSPRSMTIQSRTIMTNVAGNFPKAFLEVLDGADAGKRFDLGARQMLGRTKMAEIQVNDASVSRLHTQIIAQHGQFFIVDLGSTNTTEVNGERVSAPRRLMKGDVLRIGQVKLRYNES